MLNRRLLGGAASLLALSLLSAGIPLASAGAAGNGTVVAKKLPASCGVKTPILGVSLPDSTNPYYVAMRQGFIQAAKANGMIAKVAIAGDSDITQLAQVESFIQQKVCAVALNPNNSSPAVADVKALNKAGIPVFTVNVLVDQPTMKRQKASIVQFLGADQVEGGRVMGQLALKELGKHAKMVIGIVGYPTSVTTAQRDSGFLEALKSDGNVSVKAKVNGQVDAGVSLQVTSSMLQGNPNMNVIYADTGPATLGALKAVDQLGRAKKISIYGFCAADTKVSGAYKACTAQQPADYAKRVVENVRAYLHGKAVLTTILRPVVVFKTGQTPGPGLLG